MAIKYFGGLRTNMIDQVNTAIGASGKIRIYSGSAPASIADPVTGTLLVEFTTNAGGFGTSSGGVLTASAVASVTASATGTAGYFRITTSGGSEKVQGTVTATGGGGDMEVTSTSIVSGQTCNFTSMTITAYGA